MEKTNLKEARKISSDNYVSVDDIVNVKIGYVDSKLYDEIGSTSNFTARIVSFNAVSITFDLSKEFKAKVVDIDYGDIRSIEQR